MNSPPRDDVSLVAVDIGNTLIKIGGYSAESLAGEWPQASVSLRLETASADLDSLAAVLPEHNVRWLVSSVHRPAAASLESWVVLHRTGDAFQRLAFGNVPLPLEVEQPERLGMDRLLAALAADRLRDKAHAAIVVTLGSAITVNYLTPTGALAGGAILPGIRMAAEALSAHTDALPLVSRGLAGEPPPPRGRNTEAAIAAGLYWGAVGAVRELIARMSHAPIPPRNLFFTGGDARPLAEAIAAGAVVRDDMVLEGVVHAAKAMTV